MDIKEYIASGILESYVLGELSPEEHSMVEDNVAAHPELRDELYLIEQTLEGVGLVGAIKPPQSIKDKLMAEVSKPLTITDQVKTGEPDTKIVPIQARSTGLWPWAAAACFILAAIASYFALDYRNKYQQSENQLISLQQDNQRIASDYNRVNERLDILAEEVEISSNPDFNRIALAGTENFPGNNAIVFWNKNTQSTFIKITNLKALATDQQYQLWALVDGQPIDAGIFSNDAQGLTKLKNIAAAQAFAITIEPAGGSEGPTMENLLVIGNVSDNS